MMRRCKLVIALTAMLMMLFATTALAETLRFGTVSNSNLVNLRSGASKSTERIGAYPRGTWLRITGENGSWYQVTGPDGLSGYMMKDYVYISAGAKGIVGIVNASSSLNLRASASSSAKIIGSYPRGVPCILLSESGGWYHVTVDGKNGYFASSFLEKKYMAYSPDVATVVNPNGGAVNLRKGPGKSYGIIRSVKNGSYVMILQQGDGWWKISVDGNVGFMDSSFLKDGIIRDASGSGGGSGSTGGGSGYAVVNTGRLYLRSAASKSSKSLGLFSRGTYVTVLEQGSTWCRVKVNGTTGYMMTAYLKFHGMSSEATAMVNHPAGTYVNLRNAPSKTSGAVLVRVPHGAKVTVLVPGATWSQIKYNGTTGYMMTQFLKK